MTVTGVLAGLLAALSLIAVIGWSAVVITGRSAPPGADLTFPRQSLARVLLTVAAVLAGGCLVVLTAASFAEHL